ncbi:MAG TPA: isoaspartyl peptidase/L-asparaginase [bacterium]|nr:isoaspartyl peptidase/L-asparaginase [bacterium]
MTHYTRIETIVIHGGAWRLGDSIGSRASIQAALHLGFQALRKTGSALDGALAAVHAMEDDPDFNAGTGSSLALNGRCLMDASVMLSDGRFGAVGALEGVRHPIDVACKVMTDTDHLLICGNWATRLARFWGFPKYDPITPAERRKLKALRRAGSPYYARQRHYLSFGTVGAVALDRYRRIAVATSTGGVRGKLPGRIGDTALYGAGTFADRNGGASATGLGEEVIRLGLSRRVCDLLAAHRTQAAVDIALRGSRHVGVIALDRKGDIGLGHATPDMTWGWMRGDEEKTC